MRWLRASVALLLLAAQLAPSIHFILPHEEDRPHCTDGQDSPHVEHHDIDHDHVCDICVYASTGSPLPDTACLQSSLMPAVAAAGPQTDVRTDAPLSLPDSRGPPSLDA
jgi:hypothetical protein